MSQQGKSRGNWTSYCTVPTRQLSSQFRRCFFFSPPAVNLSLPTESTLPSSTCCLERRWPMTAACQRQYSACGTPPERAGSRRAERSQGSSSRSKHPTERPGFGGIPNRSESPFHGSAPSSSALGPPPRPLASRPFDRPPGDGLFRATADLNLFAAPTDEE